MPEYNDSIPSDLRRRADYVRGTFVGFYKTTPKEKAKTEIWAIDTLDGVHTLGWIKWFGRWRKYSFFPKGETVFEPTCLREIAVFCQAATEIHRLKKKREKEEALAQY